MRPGRVLAAFVILLSLAACATSTSHAVTCEGGDDVLLLAAQAVPEATMLPCVIAYPTGWSHGGFQAQTGSVRFWMDSDRAGDHAIEVELSEGCDTSDAIELEPDPDTGARRFDHRTESEPGLSGSRFLVFEGGCVTIRYRFDEGADPELLEEASASIILAPRSLLVTAAEEKRGLVLCGAGAPPCP